MKVTRWAIKIEDSWAYLNSITEQVSMVDKETRTIFHTLKKAKNVRHRIHTESKIIKVAVDIESCPFHVPSLYDPSVIAKCCLEKDHKGDHDIRVKVSAKFAQLVERQQRDERIYREQVVLNEKAGVSTEASIPPKGPNSPTLDAIVPNAGVTNHPWSLFLFYRAKVLRWLRDEMNSTPSRSVETMNLDVGQVHLILMEVDEHPDRYNANPGEPRLSHSVLDELRALRAWSTASAKVYTFSTRESSDETGLHFDVQGELLAYWMLAHAQLMQLTIPILPEIEDPDSDEEPEVKAG